MRTLVVPGWVWINLIFLVAAAIFVWMKIAAEKAGRQKPGPKPVSADLKRTIK